MSDHKCTNNCTGPCNCSQDERFLWPQFDALQLAIGWTEEDITKKQILVEDVPIWGVYPNKSRSAFMKVEESPEDSIRPTSVTAVRKAMMA